MTFDPATLSATARKTYSEGMAIVQRKLATARKAEATRKAEAARSNEAALVKRMGRTLAAKCYGVSTSKPGVDRAVERGVARAFQSLEAPGKPSPATKAPRKAKPVAVRNNFSTIKRFCSGGGLFGRI
jgi:hypothetical protein